jgi:hypothetical protein
MNMPDIDLSQFDGHTESLVVYKKWGQVLLLDDDGVIVSNIGWIGINNRIEANARLFAAAPELLKEVKRLRAERDRLRDAIREILPFVEYWIDTEDEQHERGMPSESLSIVPVMLKLKAAVEGNGDMEPWGPNYED